MFVESGIFYGEAYYHGDGLVPPKTFKELNDMHYSNVLDPLGVFVQDGICFENMEIAVRITEVLHGFIAKEDQMQSGFLQIPSQIECGSHSIPSSAHQPNSQWQAVRFDLY